MVALWTPKHLTGRQKVKPFKKYIHIHTFFLLCIDYMKTATLPLLMNTFWFSNRWHRQCRQKGGKLRLR